MFSPESHHMFTVKRLHRLTDYKESSPEGLSAEKILRISPLKQVHLACVSLIPKIRMIEKETDSY